MTDTNVIPLRPRADAPVQTHPRSIFGLRRAALEGGMDLGPHGKAGMEAARDADREQQLRIKRLAREARNALDGGAHVHPTLKRSLASRFEMLGRLAAMLGEEAKAQGFIDHGNSAEDIASICETVAGLIEADLPEGA
jgi:hypothetical protein